jgi:8-amino-7-oxononanoate synthase/dethiobiotin synthase
MRAVLVTGTGTDVGKTVVTAGLAAALRLTGRRVAVVKPAQTGVAPGEPGDLDEVRRLAGIEDLHEFARFPEPLAPATAARRAGVGVPTVQELADRISGLRGRDLVLIEGAGGLLVELDRDGGTLADLGALLGAPAIVVARPGLGTLNATALTCEALHSRGVHCLGIVIGAWPLHPDLAAICNLEDLPRYTSARVLARLPEGLGQLDAPAFEAFARSELTEVSDAIAAEPRQDYLPGVLPRMPPGPPRLAQTSLSCEARARLDDLRAAGLYRELRVIDSAPGPRVVLDGREVMLLCSNDYLGLAAHPAVRAAAAEAADRWGAGVGASRLVSGNTTLHHRLERELAEFKGYQDCMVFGSGFLANAGVIPALVGHGEVILSDALNHASIVDGCRQSRAETIVYDHCDLDALAAGLRRAGGRRALIVTDAVFSMDGDFAPLVGIVELARRYGARVMVDEAHATGVVGHGGRGLVAALSLEREVDVLIGTLSKALGSYGAFVCCTPDVAELLVNRARTLIFSTGLPAPCVEAARTALHTLRSEPELVDRLHRNALVLRDELSCGGFSVARSEMPIVPLVMGEPHVAMALCEGALRHGVFAQAIRPPTVPKGTSRLRLVAMATHTEDELRRAARTLAAVADAQASSLDRVPAGRPGNSAELVPGTGGGSVTSRTPRLFDSSL